MPRLHVFLQFVNHCARIRLGVRDRVSLSCAVASAVVWNYILSGMPQAALDLTMDSAGGTDWFDVIIGSPPAKPESMDRILAETGVAAERAVFIGDANADQLAALHAGTHFVYLPSEAARPQAEIVTEVNDLRELLTV